MTPEQYVYVARLVPLNQELPVVDPDEDPIVEYFEPCAFALSRTKASTVRLLIDHDDNREAGRFTTLRRDGPWLLGTFTIDFDTTPGVNAYDKLELGTPISIGFTRHTDRPKRDKPGVVHRAVATLDEASIVDRAAYPGAEVIHMWPMREPKHSARRSASHWPPGGNHPRPPQRTPGNHLHQRPAHRPPQHRQGTRCPGTSYHRPHVRAGDSKASAPKPEYVRIEAPP